MGDRRRRWPAVLAVLLVVLGGVGATARLDGPSDGSVIRFGGAAWRADALRVDVTGESALRDGDEVTSIGGERFTGGLVVRPGDTVAYQLRGGEIRDVTITRADIGGPLRDGWGDLVFVVSLALLAVALYLRRPNEPAVTPLLVAAAGLLGSTVVVVAGLPPLALAAGGPGPVLYFLNTVGVYSIAWGAIFVLALRFTPRHPWARPAVIRAGYLLPLAAMVTVTLGAVVAGQDAVTRYTTLVIAQNAVVTVTALAAGVAGVVAYRADRDPASRNRLRWVACGGVLSLVLGLAGWQLPTLLTGRPLLPDGALGLAAMPFVAGLAIALRRHRLFDIERLANRSLVYAAVVTVLAGLYTAVVALLASVLRLSDAVAAALAAAVAALVLAPLRSAAQDLVNRMMYGDRDDPAGVLAGLGGRLETVMLPDDVSPTVVETVARSLRVPYVAIDVGDDQLPAAEYGVPAGAVHVEPLYHYGERVGRLRVSGRGVDDPLEPADLALIRSLAQQIGPALQAVRLHHDLVRSRAEVVALREDERRRLRRDLHDGLGPALAAIALKAGLAARQVPAGSARNLLGEITDEVRTSLADVRRVVDALRPPALDELGLVAAVRARAVALTADLVIEVIGPADRAVLPAAVETAGYRIAVEGMTNAVRHSGGTTCTVTIEAGDREVRVEIRDDGGGLAEARTPGVGLRSMRERAAELGGECTVESAGGTVESAGSTVESAGGTVVRARLPLAVGAPG
ncbi:histidine kinase [Actinoplanes sp. GCM10030250]|uniref:histidine kinase n=1 Tax=Actinoplanes sp. GCM10030250 TaxID=3273376 RepID=UPI003621DEE4